MPYRYYDTGLAHGWSVTVNKRASIKVVEAWLLDSLRQFEAAGVVEVSLEEESEAGDLLRATQLGNAYVDPQVEPGRVFAFTGVVSTGSPMPATELPAYTSRVLSTHNDVPAKLIASGLARTHAVVLVTVDRHNVMWALDKDEMTVPSTDPGVPEGLTDVWLVPMWVGDRVLRWTRGGGWIFAGNVPESTGWGVESV